MCIAITNVASATITEKQFNNSWQVNPDGFGMAYLSKGTIVIEKEMNSAKLAYERYLKAKKSNPKSNFLLHFRIATSGVINKANCHPFKVNNTLAFIHNGMIDTKTCANHSDTYYFNELILKKLPKNWMKNEAMIELIEVYIGYSKLCFLDTENNIFIINEHLGEYDKEGNWYSNNSHVDKIIQPYKPYKGNQVTWYKKETNVVKCEMCNAKDAKYNLYTDSILCENCTEEYDISINEWSKKGNDYFDF